MPTVIEIVRTSLTDGGFGGLVSPGGECGCELTELAPCQSNFSLCQPGYKHSDPRPDHPNGWAIWNQKETPTGNQWYGVDDLEI